MSALDAFSLSGRSVLLTGAAGGLGGAFATALLEAGARVALCDRPGDALEKRYAELRASSDCLCAVSADLSDRDAPAQAVAESVDKLGGLDVVINNAAYTGTAGVAGYAVPFAEQTLDAWDAALRVNLTAPFAFAKAALPALQQSPCAAIVNIGSIYGEVGPDPSLYAGTQMGNPAAYGASKGGLIQLTRYLATVLAPHVRVNALSPGGVERGQPESFQSRYCAKTPMGRMAQPDDLTGPLLFLASDASKYMTGQHLLVDGGWTAW